MDPKVKKLDHLEYVDWGFGSWNVQHSGFPWFVSKSFRLVVIFEVTQHVYGLNDYMELRDFPKKNMRNGEGRGVGFL